MTLGYLQIEINYELVSGSICYFRAALFYAFSKRLYYAVNFSRRHRAGCSCSCLVLLIRNSLFPPNIHKSYLAQIV